MTLVARGIDAWSDDGSAKALTSGLVAGTAFKTRGANMLHLEFTVGGDGGDSVDVAVERSVDGTAFFRLPAINSVSSGSVDQDSALWVCQGAAGSYDCTVSVPPGQQVRVSAKVDNDSGTTTLLAAASLTRE